MPSGATLATALAYVIEQKPRAGVYQHLLNSAALADDLVGVTVDDLARKLGLSDVTQAQAVEAALVALGLAVSSRQGPGSPRYFITNAGSAFLKLSPSVALTPAQVCAKVPRGVFSGDPISVALDMARLVDEGIVVTSDGGGTFRRA